MKRPHVMIEEARSRLGDADPAQHRIPSGNCITPNMIRCGAPSSNHDAHTSVPSMLRLPTSAADDLDCFAFQGGGKS